MKNRRNYYRILHVGRDAPAAVIQASYRALMQRMQLHPDLGGDHEQAALINEAYATLRDPVSRAAYDRTLGDASEQRGAGGLEQPARARAGAAVPTPSASARCSLCGTSCGAICLEYGDATCAACGSALSPAPHHHLSDMSRRAIERLPRHMAVSLRLAASRHAIHAGTTEDVSLNGMCLLADVRIAIGERLQIESAFCNAVAVVRRAERADGEGRRRWQYGIEFLTLLIKRERGGLLETTA